MRPARTVADAMLRHPTVHPADLTVGRAHEVFAASPRTHLLLLADQGRLLSTVTRADLEDADPSLPAARAGTLLGRTVRRDARLDAGHELMARGRQRRVAVVDDQDRLLGLLCLKASLRGFCTDAGVEAMRRERRAS